MLSIYYTKYNLILIDGNQYFREAFQCFLSLVYNLSIFKKDEHNNITIPTTEESVQLLTGCLNNYLNIYITECKKFIKQKKIYCNTVLYFSLNTIEKNQEIFNYIDKQYILKYINKYINNLKKKKINFYIHKLNETINFSENFQEILNVSGKTVEILNIINFKLS